MPAKDANSELFAFKILKDLIWAVVARAGSSEVAVALPENRVRWPAAKLQAYVKAQAEMLGGVNLYPLAAVDGFSVPTKENLSAIDKIGKMCILCSIMLNQKSFV